MATATTLTRRPASPPHIEPVNHRPDASRSTQNSPLPAETNSTPPLAETAPAPRPPVVEVSHIFPWQSAYPERKQIAAALTAISSLVATAYRLEDASHQQTRSLKVYAKQLKFLLALSEILKNMYRSAEALDKALDDLALSWDGDDPRTALFTYLDPFASYHAVRSPDHMRTVFQAQAERIATAIEDNIGPLVERRREQVGVLRYTSYRLRPPIDD